MRTDAQTQDGSRFATCWPRSRTRIFLLAADTPTKRTTTSIPMSLPPNPFAKGVTVTSNGMINAQEAELGIVDAIDDVDLPLAG